MPAAAHTDDVTFLRRSWPSLRDLWTELVDWTPTIATGAAVVLIPYMMWKMLDPSHPHPMAGIDKWAAWYWKDPKVSWSVQAAIAVCLVVWVVKIARIVAERYQHVVRIDLHEIECWPGGRLRYIPVRDVIGAHAGWRDTSSRWWILRARRKGMWLFVRSGAGGIERVPFDWSRHEFLGIAVPLESDDDGNRAAFDLIALLRRRRAALGLPLQELPHEPVLFTGEQGLVLQGDRDQFELKMPGRTMTVPGWAIRAAVVTTSAKKGKGRRRQLVLDLDPRCGEFHLMAPIGASEDDRKIFEWCQLLAARFDKDPVEYAAGRG